MWEKILIALALRLLERIFEWIENEADEKKRLEKAEKLGGVVASAVKGFQAKHPTA